MVTYKPADSQEIPRFCGVRIFMRLPHIQTTEDIDFVDPAYAPGTGQSGKNYGYWIHPIEASFRKIAGNVIFARQTEAGEWEPVYIGQTRNFDEGFADGETENCAKNNGATHAHIHFSSPGDAVRKAELVDLVARWNPVCNS